MWIQLIYDANVSQASRQNKIHECRQHVLCAKYFFRRLIIIDTIKFTYMSLVTAAQPKKNSSNLLVFVSHGGTHACMRRFYPHFHYFQLSLCVRMRSSVIYLIKLIISISSEFA